MSSQETTESLIKPEEGHMNTKNASNLEKTKLYRQKLVYPLVCATFAAVIMFAASITNDLTYAWIFLGIWGGPIILFFFIQLASVLNAEKANEVHKFTNESKYLGILGYISLTTVCLACILIYLNDHMAHLTLISQTITTVFIAISFLYVALGLLVWHFKWKEISQSQNKPPQAE